MSGLALVNPKSKGHAVEYMSELINYGGTLVPRGYAYKLLMDVAKAQGHKTEREQRQLADRWMQGYELMRKTRGNPETCTPASIASAFSSHLTLTESAEFQNATPSQQAVMLAAMAENPAKFDRCVESVRASGSAANEYAVCTAMGLRNPMDLHGKLAHAITQYDMQQSGKRGYNMYALSQYLGAMQQALAEIESGKSVRSALVAHFNGRLLDRLLKAAGKATSTREEQRMNPESAARDLAEEFRGSLSDGAVEEIHEELHEHDYLSPLAILTSITLNTESGYSATIKFPRPGTRNEVHLASSEDGTSLYAVGGNQSVDLHLLHMSGAKWEKDAMLLGRIKRVEYWAEKRQDHFEGSIYFHRSKEGLSADGTRHVLVSKVDPVLLYDRRSQLLSFAGGQYSVESAGVVG